MDLKTWTMGTFKKQQEQHKFVIGMVVEKLSAELKLLADHHTSEVQNNHFNMNTVEDKILELSKKTKELQTQTQEELYNFETSHDDTYHSK